MENVNKLCWVALRSAVARRAGVNNKVAKQFLDALVEQLTQALEQHESVRINGLGTFRIQETAARKSVDVRTGEEITIPPYYRLSFVSDASLKKGIGFDNPTITPDSNPMRRLSEQADEIVDILGDLGQGPKATPAEPVVEEPQPIVEEPKAEEPQPVVEEPKPIVEEPKPIVAEPIIMTSTTEEKKEKKGRTWLVVGITVLIFALLLAAAFLFVGNRFISWVENLHNKATQTEQVEQVDPNQVAEPTEATDQNNTPEVVEPAQPTQTKSNLPYPYEWKEFIGSERLSEGSRLALLARKYYNETDMWVFIYEANRNTVQHPSDIPVGTKIRLPKIPRELRDLSNPETRKLVDELIVKYKAL